MLTTSRTKIKAPTRAIAAQDRKGLRRQTAKAAQARKKGSYMALSAEEGPRNPKFIPVEREDSTRD